jgi:hypothetical protein
MRCATALPRIFLSAAPISESFQTLLGHDKLETTARYTRVATGMIANIASPLDLLAQPRKKSKKPPQKAPQENSETTSTEPPPA